MSRVLSVAEAELMALVRTKFFLVGIVSMPLISLALVTFLGFAVGRIDREDRVFGVVDETGVLYERLAAAAERRNLETGEGATRSGPHFLPKRIDLDGRSLEDLRVELSSRVRSHELFAFIEIPAGILALDSQAAIDYYSQNTAYAPLSTWIERSLGNEIEKVRFQRVGVDPEMVSKLTARPDLATFGLVERRQDGTASAASRVDALERFGVPFFYLVLMFMAVMSVAQHLINTIIEEKMSKISEVLLGSISAFQLLLGKLVGIVIVSFLLSFVYLSTGIYALLNFGRPELIDFGLMAWFLVFLLCASLMFGSVFQALSSACSDLKDAQSMLQPAMMLVVATYLVSFLVVRAPDSPIAVVLSLIPLSAPFAMMLRMAMPPGPAPWEIALSLTLLISTTALIVWSAGRIFRVGLLMQGKPPNLPELLRWIRQ